MAHLARNPVIFFLDFELRRRPDGEVVFIDYIGTCRDCRRPLTDLEVGRCADCYNELGGQG